MAGSSGVILTGVKAAPAQTFVVRRGETYEITFTACDFNDAAIDISGAVGHFRVKRSVNDATITISKSTATPSEGTILAQAGATLGQFKITGIPADTFNTNGIALGDYACDAWIEDGTIGEWQVIENSVFCVDRAVTELGVTPPSPPSSVAATQDGVERSFLFTTTTTGTSFTVTIPGGMTDATYCIAYCFNTVTGAVAVFDIPDATRTASSFVVTASGTVTSGTSIDFIVRDR